MEGGEDVDGAENHKDGPDFFAASLPFLYTPGKHTHTLRLPLWFLKGEAEEDAAIIRPEAVFCPLLLLLLFGVKDS